MRHAASSAAVGFHGECFRCGWAIAIALLLLPAVAGAQSQQGGSLADAARQARGQTQGQPAADTSAAQQVADELSEDQNHNDSAPGGFKTYNAGDYTLWVPAPYTVGGHDDTGTVLSGPTVGSKRSLVLVGTPINLPPSGGDDAFRDAALQFAHLYSPTVNCNKAAGTGRSAYQCSLAAANLLDGRVSGNIWFARSGSSIYPVFCAAPTDSHNRDILNNPRSTYKAKQYAREALDREEEDVKSIWQKCDTVFQSIRVKEGGTQTAVARSAPAQAGINSAPSAQKTVAGGSASSPDISGQGKPAPATESSTAVAASSGTTVPPGLKVQAFQYCAGARQCWDASVLVPAEAQLISSDCRQYAFQMKVQGSPFLLMAGPAVGDCDNRSAGDASLVRWKELVDPENQRAPGTSSTISTQTARLDGKAAAITTLGFRKGLTEWMAKRAEVENNGIQVVVGCVAQREHFPDGDAICTALIESLRLP
jgi:hypothetical protein